MAVAEEYVQDPRDPEQLHAHARRLAKVINGGLTFGDPTDRHSRGANGRKDNMDGSWVTVTAAIADFCVNGVGGNALTFNHNLNAPTAGTASGAISYRPNVVWPVVCLRTGNIGLGAITLYYRLGGLITGNAIELWAATSVAPTDTITMVVFFQAVGPW